MLQPTTGFFPGMVCQQSNKVSDLRPRKPLRDILKQIIAVNGLADAYGFGPEFAAALAVIAIALTGDPVGQKWSIGGPFSPVLGGLLSTPSGISFSHNTYESDASIVRVGIS